METLEIVERLKNRLGEAVLNASEFAGEITVEIPKNAVHEALQFLKQTPKPGFDFLMDYSAVDYLLPEKRIKVFYWLHNPYTFERLRLITFVARNEDIDSITDIWEGADWYERELYDFFGIRFNGHSELKRLLMPDDWIGHPLLKDYALTEEVVQFKHNVKPKVPSNIIPYVKGRNKP